MIGAVSPDSFDTFHSYSNTFQMPFMTPWFPEKVRAHKKREKNRTSNTFYLVVTQSLVRIARLV